MGIEKGAGQRIEAASAVAAEMGLHAVLPPAVMDDSCRTAKGAAVDGKRVYQKYLGPGGLSVLRVEPFEDGLPGHPLKRGVVLQLRKCGP